MHPILFHLGRLAVSTDGVLVALGLLCGLQLACLLAPGLGLEADRVWTLGLASLLTLFLSQRLLGIALHLGDFLEHPFWMLGLAMVRDDRYFYGGVLLAVCAGVAYILALGLPWARVADCLAPGAGLALTLVALGSFAAGADAGRPAAAGWGVVYTSRVAARVSGTPLGVPLLPLALYAALLHLVLAGCAAAAVWRGRLVGIVAGWWLFAEGLGTVLLGQLRYRVADEALVAGVFTPAQALGVVAVVLAAVLWLSQPFAIRGDASGADTALRSG